MQRRHVADLYFSTTHTNVDEKVEQHCVLHSRILSRTDFCTSMGKFSCNISTITLFWTAKYGTGLSIFPTCSHRHSINEVKHHAKNASTMVGKKAECAIAGQKVAIFYSASQGPSFQH